MFHSMYMKYINHYLLYMFTDYSVSYEATLKIEFHFKWYTIVVDPLPPHQDMNIEEEFKFL